MSRSLPSGSVSHLHCRSSSVHFNHAISRGCSGPFVLKLWMKPTLDRLGLHRGLHDWIVVLKLVMQLSCYVIC